MIIQLVIWVVFNLFKFSEDAEDISKAQQLLLQVYLSVNRWSVLGYSEILFFGDQPDNTGGACARVSKTLAFAYGITIFWIVFAAMALVIIGMVQNDDEVSVDASLRCDLDGAQLLLLQQLQAHELLD